MTIPNGTRLLPADPMANAMGSAPRLAETELLRLKGEIVK